MVAVSRPITNPVSVGASPAAAQAPASSADGTPPVDAAMRWMIDFDAAMDCGMALRLPLTDPSDPAARGVDRLLVLGIRHSQNETESAAQLKALFDAHRFTSGTALLPLDTPTNNTEEVTSPFNRTDDADDSYDVFLKNAAQFTLTTDPLLKRDGQWFADQHHLVGPA